MGPLVKLGNGTWDMSPVSGCAMELLQADKEKLTQAFNDIAPSY